MSSTIFSQIYSDFFIGEYEKVSNKCSKIPPSSLPSEFKSYYCRSLIYLGQQDEALNLCNLNGALDEALRLYASVFPLRDRRGAGDGWNEGIFEEVERVSGLEGDRDESAIILSIIYSWGGRLEEAYRMASQSASLEAHLLLVSYLCQINRFDLANSKMERLKKGNVENVAYQLLEAEVATLQGGDRVKDAVYIYQDMLEVYGRTIKLSNLYAAALIMAGRSSEAEGVVLEVLNKNPHEPTALSLLINISVTRGAGINLINDQLARLAASQKSSPFLRKLESVAVEIENFSKSC